MQACLTLLNAARNLKLRQQYYCFNKKSINRQNVDVWLNKYIKMYIQRKTIRLSDIMNIQRAYIDFLHIIEKQIFIFINTYKLFINATSATMNFEIQIFIVIEKFRHHMRLKKTRKKKTFAFNSAFAVDENNKLNKSNKSKFNKNTLF